jgi:hypothetical protein
MIGKRPTGSEPGRYSDENSDRAALQLNCAYNELSKKYLLPPKSSVSIEELASLGRLKRWAPIINDVLYKKVKEEYSKHNTISEEGINLSENQSSRLLNRRLSMFLLTCDKPIMIMPKPGQDFSLFYLIYCCHIADPGNCIGWKEDLVSCSRSDMSEYFVAIWDAKNDCLQALPQYGVDVNTIFFKNASIDLRRAGVGFYRYLYQINQKSGDTVYAKAQKKRCAEWIKATTDAVTRVGYTVYLTSGGNMEEKTVFERVRLMLGFLFVVDFFYPAYDLKTFNDAGGILKAGLYDVLAQKGAIYESAKVEYTYLYSRRQHNFNADAKADNFNPSRGMPTNTGTKTTFKTMDIKKDSLVDRIPKMVMSELAKTIRANKGKLKEDEKAALAARYRKLNETKPSSTAQEKPKFVCDPVLANGKLLSKRADSPDSNMSGSQAEKRLSKNR